MILLLPLLFSLAGAPLVYAVGGRRPSVARWLALVATVLGLGTALAAAADWGMSREVRTLWQAAWVPSLGIGLHFAADGVSLVLVILTGLLPP